MLCNFEVILPFLRRLEISICQSKQAGILWRVNMLAYSRITLLSIRNSLKVISKSSKASHGSFPRPVSSELWQRLAFYNLQALSRGQRGGAHLRRNNARVIPTLKPQVKRRYSVLSKQNGVNFSNLLNIQFDTSRSCSGTTTIVSEQQQAGNNLAHIMLQGQKSTSHQSRSFRKSKIKVGH